MGSINYRGAIKSLSQPGDTGWLAYDTQVKRLKGPVMLRSTARGWTLNVQGSLTSLDAQVLVEGAHLGNLRTQDSDVLMLDAGNETIGVYRRFARQQLRVHLNQRRLVDVEPGYGQVELSGRILAEINHNLIPNRYVERLDQPAPSLLQNIDPALAPHEVDWLVALLGLEIYRRITRMISERSRSYA
jgi:hypothetical protein